MPRESIRATCYWCIDQVGEDGVTRPPHEWRGARTLEDALDNPPPGQKPVLHDLSLLDGVAGEVPSSVIATPDGFRMRV